MKLHALSVVAPAGDWIAKKKKTIEVRSLVPEKIPLINIAIIQNENYLLEDGQEDENGYIVAIVDFKKIEPWEKQQQEAACSTKWESGYFGWHITNVRKLVEPVKATAKRKIYEIEFDENQT